MLFRSDLRRCLHGLGLLPVGIRVMPQEGFVRTASPGCAHAAVEGGAEQCARAWQMISWSLTMALCRTPFDVLYNRADAINVHMARTRSPLCASCLATVKGWHDSIRAADWARMGRVFQLSDKEEWCVVVDHVVKISLILLLQGETPSSGLTRASLNLVLTAMGSG